MKNKFKLLFIVVVFTFCGTAKGEIIPTYSIDSITIKNLDNLIDENTVVFVELDDEEDALKFNYENLKQDGHDRLKEISQVDGPKLLNKIQEVEHMLFTIEKKKKFMQIKVELVEKSLQMMYNRSV